MMLTLEDIHYIGKCLKAQNRKSRLAGYFEGVMQDYKPPPHASPTPPPSDSSCDSILPTTSNSGAQGSLESSPHCPMKSDIELDIELMQMERRHCEYSSSQLDSHG
jgi:hypothetical protein